MAFKLDHTEVPSLDRAATAQWFAEVFGLEVGPPQGRFARVQMSDTLTLDFADHAEAWKRNHYAFYITDAEFDATLARVKEKGVKFGDGPHNYENGGVYQRNGGRGFYFLDPNGHLLEVMTAPETGVTRP